MFASGNLGERRRLKWVVGHLILGAVLSILPILGVFYFLGIVYFSLSVFKMERKEGEKMTMMFLAYFVSFELALKILKVPLPYDVSKYYVMVYMVAVLLHFKGWQAFFSTPLTLFIFCLLPACFLVDFPEGEFRRQFMATAGGLLLIYLLSIFCYLSKLSLDDLYFLLFCFGLPVIAISVVLFLKTPDFSSIKFTTASNSATSGGFGPNQVSTILGLGVYAVGALIIIGRPFSGYRWLDFSLFGMMVFRNLITFSRGGFITAVIGLIIILIGVFVLGRNLKQVKKLLVTMLVIGAVSGMAFQYIDGVTGGLITNRYVGKDIKGNEKEDITSNRGEIIAHEMEGFYRYPVFGVGLGMGKYFRVEELGLYLTNTHNEISRMVSEHGVFGIFALLVLCATSFKRMKRGESLMFSLSFLAIAFLTVNHSAIRLVMPTFLFALSNLKLVSEND